MSGYTPDSVALEGPDIDLVAALARALKTPLLAEGRYYTPGPGSFAALRAGATSVVVSAITRPQEITKRFVRGGEVGK